MIIILIFYLKKYNQTDFCSLYLSISFNLCLNVYLLNGPPGVDELFLSSQGLATQVNLDKIAKWTEENLKLLRETKTDYQVFTRVQNRFYPDPK